MAWARSSTRACCGSKHPTDEPRYRMLEPIREFALERLETSGQAEAIRDRHASRFLEIAENAAPHLTSDLQRHWLDRLEADLDNLRAALDHATASVETETALRFVAALWRFWQIRGYLLEGIGRAKAVVAMPGTEAYPAPRLAALEALGGLAWWMADYETCRDSYEQALELRRADGDPAGIARALYNLSFPLLFGSDEVARAREMLEEAKDLFVQPGDADGEARAWWGLANATYRRQDLETGREAAERAAAHFRKRGMRFDLGWAVYTLGQLSAQAGDAVAAEKHFGEALDLFADVDDLSGITMSLDGLATAAYVGGDLQHAARISARSHAWSASAAPASTPRTGRSSPSSPSACATTRPRRLRGPREPRATCRTSSSWRGPGRR